VKHGRSLLLRRGRQYGQLRDVAAVVLSIDCPVGSQDDVRRWVTSLPPHPPLVITANEAEGRSRCRV